MRGDDRDVELEKFYKLPEGSNFVEITPILLKSPLVQEENKQSIINWERRIFVFCYPSDGLKIKGFISFSTKNNPSKSIVYLRGGNRSFGLPNPAGDLVCYKNYTFISTLYRGGLSEGKDEFGGDDTKDVKNLFHFLPELEQRFGIKMNKKISLFGASRGGLQMFLALAKHPEIQAQVDKAISLSWVLDLRQLFQNRAKFKELCIKDFGLNAGPQEDEWIEARDTVTAIEKIREDLPIFIIQGSKDERVNPIPGRELIKKMKSNKKNISFLELEDGIHCLSNIKDRMERVVSWVESIPFPLSCDVQ